MIDVPLSRKWALLAQVGQRQESTDTHTQTRKAILPKKVSKDIFVQSNSFV